ncbi:MAG: 2Fe-2S iron-sulfur cluster-binding protein [Rubrivivax sp.]|nr:2Fe-2S iron-sulfur cluster-binding protein [Rubrivivax sp.]
MAVKLTIDQREIEALDGENVLQAARRHGIDIPHFCYHDKLSVAGNCRMCLVKVNGLPKLMPACNLPVAPKMNIETMSDDVQRARRQVMQFILLNHPVDCGICDKAGECTLQDNQFRYGSPESRSVEPKLHQRKLHELSPRISLDNERCILCSRCVRFTREISGSNALGIVDRGCHSYVERVSSQPFDDAYSDNVIGLCPTGALLSADFLYKSRVWFLEPVRSVCTGCARGCSIDAWRRVKAREPKAPGMPQPQVWRISAHDNPQINGPWLCNKGFDLHKTMLRERPLQPALTGQPASVVAALAQARRLLAEARKPALLVSAHASNEELDVCKALLGGRVTAYVRQDVLPAAGEVLEDALLIRADKNPNSFGVQARFGSAAFDATVGHDLVVVWGEFTAFAGLGDVRIVHLSTYGPAPDKHIDVAMPISTTFERSGSFSNFEGRTNSFAAVLEKPPEVQHAADVFRSLAT